MPNTTDNTQKRKKKKMKNGNVIEKSEFVYFPNIHNHSINKINSCGGKISKV